MKTLELTFPELALIASTRGMLGAAISLLVADCVKAERRKAFGATLLAIGALSTVPLALQALGRRRERRAS